MIDQHDLDPLNLNGLSFGAQVGAGVLILVTFTRGQAVVPYYIKPETLELPDAMAELGSEVSRCFKRWEKKHGGFVG